MASVGYDDDSPLIDQIEGSIPLLQRLDDARGGAANLAYVGAQVRAVSMILTEGAHPRGTTRRLLMALAELSQLAGWMAFDANNHGLCQRYLFTSLRAAHDAGYRAMAAHVLADLSVQATSRGHSTDAIQLGEAAVNAAASTSHSVQASVHSRLAHAYAGAGRVHDFRTAHQQALDMIETCGHQQEPAWMYYLTRQHLECQAGYSLIMLGHRQTAENANDARPLLKRGRTLLATGAHDRPLGDPSQRRALYEGAWLAVASAALGDYEQACTDGSRALARLETVKSPRSDSVLLTLSNSLSRRARNIHVRDFVPQLRHALTTR